MDLIPAEGRPRTPGAEPHFVERGERSILRRFAWADGVSSSLYDTYRGGKVASFGLSALAIVHARASLLLSTYRLAADLAHDIDDVVVSEIENWQAVFGGKNVTVPV